MVSTTVIVPVPVPVLPAASVAWQVTVVAPSPKRLPDGGTQVGVSGPSTLSTALAAYDDVRAVGPVASTVLLSTVTTGGVTSLTAMSTVWTNSGPGSSPLTRNSVVQVTVSPCGASPVRVIVSSNVWSHRDVTVLAAAVERQADPGSQVVSCVTTAGRFCSWLRMVCRDLVRVGRRQRAAGRDVTCVAWPTSRGRRSPSRFGHVDRDHPDARRLQARGRACPR